MLAAGIKTSGKKLNQINGFKMASAGLFLEMYSYFYNVRQGLACMHGEDNSFNPQNYDVHCMKEFEYLKEIKEDWNQKDQILESRKNEMLNMTFEENIAMQEYLQVVYPSQYKMIFEDSYHYPSSVIDQVRADLEKNMREKLVVWRLWQEIGIIQELNAEELIEITPTRFENGWLSLYNHPTVDEPGRFVNAHPEGNKYDWGMPEDLINIDEYSLGEITDNYNTMLEGQGKEAIVNVINGANLYVDADGRYYVAVGPNVMNENHASNQAVTPSEMFYGTKLDIVVLDEKTNTTYYIPAVVADCKAHTYPDGVYQTNMTFPNGEVGSGSNADGSTVEFIGYDIPSGTVNTTNNYRIEGIIVYDEVLNY